MTHIYDTNQEAKEKGIFVVEGVDAFLQHLKESKISVRPLTQQEIDDGVKNYVWASVRRFKTAEEYAKLDYLIELPEISKTAILDLIKKTCDYFSIEYLRDFNCDAVSKLIDNSDDDFYKNNGIVVITNSKEMYITFQFDRYGWHDFPVLEVA